MPDMGTVRMMEWAGLGVLLAGHCICILISDILLFFGLTMRVSSMLKSHGKRVNRRVLYGVNSYSFQY